MALFAKRGTDASLPKNDRGAGSFNDYGYDLTPRNRRISITLGASDPHQDELRTIAETGELEAETAISPRTMEQERVDAPIEVRLFTGRISDDELIQIAESEEQSVIEAATSDVRVSPGGPGPAAVAGGRP